MNRWCYAQASLDLRVIALATSAVEGGGTLENRSGVTLSLEIACAGRLW